MRSKRACPNHCQHRKSGELGLELKAVDEELARHEEKWLAISEEIETETRTS